MPEEYTEIEIDDLKLCVQCGALIAGNYVQAHNEHHEAISLMATILKVLTKDVNIIKALLRSKN